ncbi:MAG TPA: allantoate amidohydrolase [Terracidiphilus sp.]|jgi:allantoate deiminase|nr:allantoate amidohydrolase [Terracidiphilus sp.]
MSERARRAIEECKQIATMSEDPERITRRFLTPPVRLVHAHLRARMEALGMTARVDAAGNLRGLWTPKNKSAKRLLIGSHIDTVPDAGAYDGVLGVMLALEWVGMAQEIDAPYGIEVIAFSEEEGVRFGVPFIGSRAVAGRFDAELLTLKDGNGVSLEEALRSFGLDPADLGNAEVNDGAIGFIEVHIEQGPVLEAEGLSVAAVTGIVGQSRLTMEFVGQANHAGTTPMDLRHDALAGAAEWIAAVEGLAQQTKGLAATVGKIVATPNAGNVIAGTAKMTLDARHPHDASRLGAVEQLIEAANAIASRRGLAVEYSRQMDQPAVTMDERLTSFLTESISAGGFAPRQIFSGAGHDAMVMAARLPTAMLFLRSPGGVSHSPAETVREVDVEASLKVGLEFLKRLSAEVG